MKPTHQWETALHVARRTDERPVRGLEDDPRAEAFELSFHGGQTATVRLGLRGQLADDVALTDPDLPHAIRCWLAARGARTLRLHRMRPEDAAGSCAPTWSSTPVDDGAFSIADLGDEALAGPGSRLISLCPSNAEMLAALGCFDRVVACEDSSDHPEQVAGCERLGPDLGPDLDRIEALAPDLVVSSLSVPGMERIVTGLRARNVPQIVLAPRSIADVLEEITRLAHALGVDSAAAAVVDAMRSQVAELQSARRDPPARVYLEWWPKPMFSPGADCYSNELIALAGGVNVFGDRAGSSVEISREELIHADPDVCFVSWCGVHVDKLDVTHLEKRGGLEDLRVVREGHVLPLDERFSGRPGPRMLEAARIMAEAIRRLPL